MPSLEDNFPNVHLHSMLLEYIDTEALWDPSDFSAAIRQHKGKILDPDPFSRNKKNSSDRQTLSTQPTPTQANLPADLKLTQESFNSIISLSDDLNLNELECARQWHNATKMDIIAQVSMLSGRSAHEVEKNPVETAKFIFFIERSKLLTATTHLFKARYYANHMQPDKHALIMKETNELMRGGIAMKYMDRMVKGLAELKEDELSKDMRDFIISSMHTMSETLFFLFYQTQITSAESVALTQLLLEMSSCQLEDAHIDWLPAALRVLVVLQLAQIRALNQVQELFSRDVDSAPFSNATVGNNLPTPLGSKDFMEQDWPCAMARGLSCLAYAILRQPAVEASILPSSEVLWFLRQSSICRVFSYIRCSMLPVLQAMHTDANQQLYLSVLSDLVYNSLTLFTQSNYHATGFPFPVSQMSYLQDDKWGRTGDTGVDAGATRPPRDTQEDTADCISAICNAYPPFAVRFWSTSSNADDADISRMSSVMNSTARALDTLHHHPFIGKAVDGILQDSVLIVPVLRMLAAVAHGAAALVPSLSSRVVVGAETNIGTIPHSGQACALATYNLLKHKHPGRLDWAYLFHIIESYARSLLSQQNSNSNQKVELSAQSSAARKGAPKLLPKDVDALCAMMELIGAVTHEPSVMHAFVGSGYAPIRRLFSLLAAPVPCRLKGKIYQALSVICKAGHEFAHEIWDSLESYDVLSLMPSRDIASNFYGIRYELEAIESAEGNYSATDGFLCLFEALLTHHKVPDAIGMGYRLPGITGYLDFVIDEVLLKDSHRSYLIVNKSGAIDISSPSTGPSGSQCNGQRWSIASHAIKILAAVIQQYPINEIVQLDSGRDVLWHFSRMQSGSKSKSWTQEEIAEYSADFSEVTREYNIEHTAAMGGNVQNEILEWPRPKSSGFVIMARLLDSYGAILNCLMSILRENSSLSLDEVYSLQLEARSVDAVRVLMIAAVESQEANIDPVKMSRTGLWDDHRNNSLSTRVSYAASHVFDYGLLAMSPACSDALFWREKCVNATIGLLYECSLREKQFLQCIASAPPLTVMRNVNGRPTVQELHLCEMFISLASYQSRSPYAIIAHFIQYSAVASRFVVVMPTVPVMSVRILELAAPQGSSAESQLLRANDVFEEPVNFAGGSKGGSVSGVGLTRACALALRDPSDILPGQSDTDPIAMSIAKHGVAPPSDVVPVGASSGGCKHDLFTLTLSDDSNYSSSANVDVEVLVKIADDHPSVRQPFINSDETEALMGYSSAQGAVLDFLLRGLNKNRYGVVHRLLGFVEGNSNHGNGGKFRLRSGINKTGGSGDSAVGGTTAGDSCLLAALDVLDNMPTRLRHDEDGALAADKDGGNSASMNCSLQTYDIANKSMELLYTLCANTLTSDAVLELLRQRLVRNIFDTPGVGSSDTKRIHSFYMSQLQLCLCWASSPCFSNSKDATAAQTIIHTCRLNYVAWFLKILALELHTSEIRYESNVSARQVARLLSALFVIGPGDNSMLHLYGHRAVSSEPLPITHLMSLLSPVVAVPVAVDSADIVSAFTTSSRPYYVGVVANNEALVKRGGVISDTLFALISLKEVKSALQGISSDATDNVPDSSSVESDIQKKLSEAAFVAATYNRYTVLMASSSHLCNAWRQVVDVSLLGWGKLLLPEHSEGNVESSSACISPSILIDDILMPVITLLSSRTDMEMVSAEPLSRSLLSMTAFLREICALRINRMREQSDQTKVVDRRRVTSSTLDISGGAILSEPQHDSMITGLICAILRRGSNGVPRINGSVMYRSFLYSALIHMLRMMTVDSYSNADDDGKVEYEAAAGEYRARNMAILEPFSSILAEMMIRDAVSSNSAPCWKLTAVASLGTLMSVLLVSPFSDDSESFVDREEFEGRGAKRSRPFFTNFSSGFHQIIQQLTNKGHLHDIFVTSLVHTARHNILDMGLFRATLEMCVPVASSAEGVSILLDNKLLQFINELKPIDPVPVLLEDSIGFASTSDLAAMKQESEDLIDDLLTPVLRVFRAMLSVSPLCIPLLEGCANYFHRNADVVKHLLSLKIKSLKGLSMIKSLVGILSIISAYKGPKGADTSSNMPPRIPIADYFITELTNLLKRIGLSPIPGLHQTDNWIHSIGGNHDIWWTAVQPSSELDWVLVARPATSPLSLNVATNAVRQKISDENATGLGLNRTWSIYDSAKLQLGHQILQSTASIMRSVATTSEFHKIMAADLDIAAIAEVFNCCAELILTKNYAGDTSGPIDLLNRNHSRGLNGENKGGIGNRNFDDWLTSTKPVLFHREKSAASGFGLSAVASLAARAAGIKQEDTPLADSNLMDESDDTKPCLSDNNHVKSDGTQNAGNSSIDRSLAFVTENLICALYCISQSHSSKDLAAVSAELQNSVRYCERFPAHSFISEVGRWLGKAV